MILNHGIEGLDCCAIWELSGFDDHDGAGQYHRSVLYRDLVVEIEGVHCTERGSYRGVRGAGFVLATLTPYSPRYAVTAVKLLGMKLVSKNVNPRTGHMLRLYHATGATIRKNLPKLKAAIRKLPKPKLRAHDWSTNDDCGVTCLCCFTDSLDRHNRTECAGR